MTVTCLRDRPWSASRIAASVSSIPGTARILAPMDASEPVADRPSMPGYGLAAPDDGDGLLPWSWAEERLTEARNYWVSTADEHGRPHAMPVWAVWIAGALYFSTGRRTRKTRNLTRRPECVVAPESGAEAVVLEGEAEELTDRATRVVIAAAYT